jgi:hypothetical protein
MPFPSRHLTLLCSISVAALTLPLGAVLTAQREVTQRHVYVRVVDAKGAPVATLTPRDVVVREDGVAREVIGVSAAPPPTHLVLLVDNSPEAERVLIELRTAVTAFARQMNQLAAPPAMMLTTFAERPTRVVDFTTSDIAIENGIKKVFPRPGSGAYFLDAIVETTGALQKAKAARPVIVAFTMDASAEFSDRVHRNVEEALDEAKASLWTIQLQTVGARTGTNSRERESVVGDVTTWSGGMNKPVLSAQGLAAAFAEVAAAILGRVDVTYGRPASLIPPKRISVEARDKTLRLSAPRWTTE